MNLEHITQQLCVIAQKAGAFIKQEAAHFDHHSIEYKDVNNLVSYVDKETEKMLVAALHELLPEAGFITEEGTTAAMAQRANPDQLFWVIDPLDGTTNFVHGLPVYCVSVGLVQQKTPIAGVVYHVPNDETYSAWQGGGAFCNGRRISVSTAQTLDKSLLATGFPYYKFENQDKYLQILEELMKRTHGLRRMGAAAIDLAYVAAGKFEGFYEYNLNSWDMAAGIILVREAGGTVTDFAGGDDFLFGGNVVAACAVHPELLEVIQDFWP